MILKVNKKYNWCISQDTVLPISKDKLWEIISKPNNLELYHPFCKKNPIIDWPGLKSIDQVHYYNDLIYERNFINMEFASCQKLLLTQRLQMQLLKSRNAKSLGHSRENPSHDKCGFLFQRKPHKMRFPFYRQRFTES